MQLLQRQGEVDGLGALGGGLPSAPLSELQRTAVATFFGEAVS